MIKESCNIIGQKHIYRQYFEIYCKIVEKTPLFPQELIVYSEALAASLSKFERGWTCQATPNHGWQSLTYYKRSKILLYSIHRH